MGRGAGRRRPGPGTPRGAPVLTSACPDTTALTLFVYGTLKSGFPAHQRLCPRSKPAGDATVRGRLYLLPAGYPALDVARDAVLAHGSPDLRADAVVQADAMRTQARRSRSDAVEGPGAAEESVHGELLFFGRPEDASLLDGYEGFVPGGGGLYDRILVTAWTASGVVPVWTYVVEAPEGRRLPGGRWPGASSGSVAV